MEIPNCYDCQHSKEVLVENDGKWYFESELKFVCNKAEEKDIEVKKFMKKYNDTNVIIQRGPHECCEFKPWTVHKCSREGCAQKINSSLHKAIEIKMPVFISGSNELFFFCSEDCKTAHQVLIEINGKEND